MTISIDHLERNNIDGALRYAEQELDRGALTTDDCEMLLRMQDETEPWLTRFKAMRDARRAAGKHADAVAPQGPEDDD